MWRTRTLAMVLSMLLLLSWMQFVQAGEDRTETRQQGEFDFSIANNNISFSPSQIVAPNDNVRIDAEVTRGGDKWSTDWTKEGLNIPLGGGGFDDTHMVSPVVIHDGGTYKMWYSGATGLGDVYKIMYATSPDGDTWTKLGVVLDVGTPGTLDDQKVCYPYVMKDGSTYKMWYGGADDSIQFGGKYRIFYATSNDGITWNRQGLVLDVGPAGSSDERLARSPFVLNESGQYKMWYAGRDTSDVDRIHYATSPDGISWTKQGIVLDIGSSGDYDETGVAFPFVWRDTCGYNMFYAGRQVGVSRILNAVSPDGIFWMKRGLVLDVGPDPAEDTRVDDVFLLMNGSIPERMWYAAFGSNYQIFTASPTFTDLATSASITFYLDVISPPNLIEEHAAVQFPICGCRVASANWTATLTGVHEVIVVVDRQDLVSELNESNNIASRLLIVLDPLTKADAGPDQMVDEGDAVELNASASHGVEEVQYWSDSFDDGSKVSNLANTSIQMGSVVLAGLSFEETHLFDVDPGFTLLDNQSLTNIWWDPVGEVVRWHSDRDDPADTWERFVGRLPIVVSDRYDIRADVYYLYTQADPVSEVYPLLLKDHGNYRSTSHFDPANNSMVYLLYGGNPDRHSLLFWDGLYNRHEPLSQVYDNQFNKLLHASISYDSITRVLYIELRDDVGALVSSGSVIIPPGNFRLTEFGVGAIGTGPGGGVSEGYTDTLSLRAYGYPDGNVTSILIEPQNMVSWGELSFNTSEPVGTSVAVDVLDEFGNPIISGLTADDSPVVLTGLIDPVLYPRIRLNAVMSTDRNETPSLLDWNVSYVTADAMASYHWDINHLVDSNGDGNFTNDVDLDGEVVYSTYGDNGLYKVHLNATTNANESFYDMCNVTVLNLLPSVIATPPSTLEEGSQLSFDLSMSDPGSDDLTLMLDWGDGSTGSWTYYNDGMGPDPPNSPEVNPMSVVGQWNHTYGHGGLYALNVTVIDDDGGTTTLILPLDISNVKPTSVIDVSQPNPAVEGSSVLLGGCFDDPSWLDNHTVTWDFGDGQTAPGSFSPGVGFTHHVVDNVSHAYGDDGVFQVTMNVTDDLGGSDEASVAITVLNLNPNATINCPSKVSVGIGFQCFTNATEPGSDDLTVDWDWGDGTAHSTTTYFNNGVSPDPDPSPGPVYPFSADDLAAHSYALVGNYTIVLNVTDDDGGYIRLQLAIEVVGPPETTIVIGNPQYVSTDVFVTSSTPISFIVWDRSGTGIESTYYRVDGGNWIPYLFPFSIATEGPHTIYFNSTDMLGGAEETKNFSLIVDDTPPSSVLTVGTPNYTDVDLWIAPSTPLTITSVDSSCGLSHVEYDLDSTGWVTYSAPLAIAAEGSHVLLFRGVDNLGNMESSQTLSFWVDGSAPTSSVVVGTPNYTAVNLWISPSTTLGIAAVDSGSGLSYVEYQLDGSGWMMYSAPITVPAEGAHVLLYRAVDNLGFVENQRTLNFWVDSSAPYSDIFVGSPNYTAVDLWISDSTLLTIVSNDDGSGVSLIEYDLDGGGWQTYTAPITVAQEGSHVLTYRATDNLGHVEVPANLAFNVDSSPPTSLVSVGTPNYTGVDLWISPSTVLTVASTDSGCGLSAIQYQLDGGGWQTYTAPITVPAEGSHLLLYRGIDSLGTTEDPGTLMFWVDATAPVSDVTVGTPSYSDVNLWISPTTTLEIASSDAGSGVALIEYQIDGGGWQTYMGPITVPQEGTHFLVYRGIDNLGHDEDPRSLVFLVDGTPPTSDIVVGTPSYSAVDLWITPSTPIALSSTDSGCGLQTVEYQIDGGGWQTYSASFTVSQEGSHELLYRGVDNLGNLETEGSLDFIVDGTAPSSVEIIGSPNYTWGGLWIAPSTTIGVQSQDQGCGLSEIEYSLDGGGWQTYTAPLTILSDGAHTLSYRGVDNLGNVETDNSINLFVDGSPPSSQIAVGLPNYTTPTLWISPLTPLTITSTDSGCGLSNIEYRLDQGVWMNYTTAINVSTEGTHTLLYRGVDNLGNTGADLSISFVVDGTPPTSSIAIGEPKIDVTPVEVYQETGFTISSVDARSGVKIIEYRIDSGAWTEYTGGFNLTGHNLGIHTIEFRAYDNLDNLEDIQSITVDLIEPAALEDNLKPMIAIVFAIILAVVGALLAMKRPFITANGEKRRGFTFLAMALPFVLAEVVTGIMSLFVAAIEVPPWFGAGMILDLVILIVGLGVELVYFAKNKSQAPEEVEPSDESPD